MLSNRLSRGDELSRRQGQRRHDGKRTRNGIPSEQLIGVVRGVRNATARNARCGGGAVTVAASWAILAASAYAMSALHYGDGAVLATRIVSLLAIRRGSRVVSSVLPLRQNSARPVALYLEEHEHSLKASVTPAVEMQRAGPPQTAGCGRRCSSNG